MLLCRGDGAGSWKCKIFTSYHLTDKNVTSLDKSRRCISVWSSDEVFGGSELTANSQSGQACLSNENVLQ